MGDFTRCIDLILAEEGGQINRPRDPGGLTKYGISQRSYPDLNIAALTRETAIALYRRDYWNPVHGDELPDGLDLLVLDSAANQGPATAIKLLQEALGVAGRPTPPRPARSGKAGRRVQSLVPVARRLGIDEARVVAQDPPQPQPADDVQAIDAVAVVGGHIEQPRLQRRRAAGRGRFVDRRPHQAVGQRGGQGVGDPQPVDPVSEIARRGPFRFCDGFRHVDLARSVFVASRGFAFRVPEPTIPETT